MAPTESTLSALYLIADLGVAEQRDIDVVEVVSDYVRAGGRMVSVRPAGVDDRTAVDVGKQIASRVVAAGGTLMVHRRVDLAVLLGADGVHLPARGLVGREIYQVAGQPLTFGRSTHDEGELRRAVDDGADFVTLGPMFESVSKPGYGPRLETEEFQGLVEDIGIPVYALGGVVVDNVRECLEAGADGVAVVGGIVGADSAFEATRRYIDALQPCTTGRSV